MTDPVPLTAEEERDLRLYLPGMTLDRMGMEVPRLLATLDRDRATPSVDGLREPDQPDPIETFSHPFRAPVNIDGHLFTHTSDCPWALAATPTPAPER